MEIKKGIVNSDDNEGFVIVKDFKGQTTTIHIDKLSGLIRLIKHLKSRGFRMLDVGVEQDLPMILFLDRRRSFGYAVAPLVVAEDHNSVSIDVDLDISGYGAVDVESILYKLKDEIRAREESRKLFEGKKVSVQVAIRTIE